MKSLIQLSNLSEEDYSFGSYQGTFNQRFTLMFEAEPVLGTNDFGLNDLIVYPNPTNDVLYIQSGTTVINEIKVFDLLGRTLVQQTPNTPTSSVALDLSTLNAATYLVEITTDAGTVIKQVIKK